MGNKRKTGVMKSNLLAWADFRFKGKGVLPEFATRKLGFDPSMGWRCGEIRTLPRVKAPYVEPYGLWLYRTRASKSKDSPVEHMQRLLNKLEGRRRALEECMLKFGGESWLKLYLGGENFHCSVPVVILERIYSLNVSTFAVSYVGGDGKRDLRRKISCRLKFVQQAEVAWRTGEPPCQELIYEDQSFDEESVRVGAGILLDDALAFLRKTAGELRKPTGCLLVCSLGWVVEHGTYSIGKRQASELAELGVDRMEFWYDTPRDHEAETPRCGVARKAVDDVAREFGIKGNRRYEFCRFIVRSKCGMGFKESRKCTCQECVKSSRSFRRKRNADCKKTGIYSAESAFRIVGIPEVDLLRWKVLLKGLVSNPSGKKSREEAHVLSVDLQTAEKSRKLMRRLNGVGIPYAHGVCVAMVSMPEAGGVRVPDHVMEVYRKLGGSFDVSFIVAADDK